MEINQLGTRTTLEWLSNSSCDERSYPDPLAIDGIRAVDWVICRVHLNVPRVVHSRIAVVVVGGLHLILRLLLIIGEMRKSSLLLMLLIGGCFVVDEIHATGPSAIQS